MASFTTETNQLFPDISDIVERYEDEVYKAVFTIETKLHTVDKDLNTEDGVILNALYIKRDYINKTSDYIEAQLSLHLGTYVYDLYPYLDNIEVTLITRKQLTKEKKVIFTKERYKAIFLLDKNISIPTSLNHSKEDLDQQMPVVITIQLLDRSVETIRVKTMQGNFDKKLNLKNTDMSPKAFLKSIISEESNKILIENKQPIDYISIEEPDQKDQLKSITIPSFTRIVELPEFLQNKNIGVYNSGIGNYIQIFGKDHYTFKKVFFVYSLYDETKYDKAEYKLIFYVPTTSAISLTDLTYKYKDKVLKAIPFKMSKIEDNKESGAMSHGSGFRISNANSFMKKPVKMTDKGPVFDRNQLNSEIVYKDRKDNLNFAPNKSITNNHFTLTSDVLKDSGAYVSLEVTNMDHDFIYPAASCKIMYEDKNSQIKELKGVVHIADISYTSSSMDMAMNYSSSLVALTCHISLKIFCHPE